MILLLPNATTQVHANGSKGDLADSFAFHTFFPNVVQPPIALVCGAIFAVLVRLRVCRKTVRRYDMAGGAGGVGGGPGGGAISISLPGVEPGGGHDTERRRQIALRALSERLNRPTPPSTAAATPQKEAEAALLTTAGEAAASWPNLEEEEETTTKPSSSGVSPSVHVPVPDQGTKAEEEDVEAKKKAAEPKEESLITIEDK